VLKVFNVPAPKEIIDLVERFNRNRAEYQSGKYNETQLRREFLDPFFKALGWDVFNELGSSEAYKEVIHEDAIKVGVATKAPDYCFRLGGIRKFFVEAKKPSVNIKDDISPAFQLRRYAWSAKLPLSILSDFEELAVYDCRVKPAKNDKATTARILYYTFDQFTEKWDEIAGIFSPTAIRQGSFDKYAEAKRTGTVTVDDAFLEQIEKWRDELARNLALRNPKLSVGALNFSVQKIIDRVIFLRICEDRGIEPEGRLLAQVNGANVYRRLAVLFQKADERYNSGLFHFQKEKDRPEQLDVLTLDLKVDDKIFKDIIEGLYYPESPYEFSALPADILGQVYEQFLGKVIRLTEGHRAVVEDKPAVKKAGGVFYTPTYIVDYIVKNTVGKLCEGKTPKQVSKLRFLDPACGSGSFLIGAYQYLLNWHLDWYEKDGPEKHQKELFRGPGGAWKLTTDIRKAILLNNLYGVDIDDQAVEVTKLSLLLKVLEGESDETLQKQLAMFHVRALPDLDCNIKCGNSLIGPDHFSGQLLPDADEMRRVNPFDWNREFQEIMAAGGFDAVIGNPPYIRIQTMKEWAPLEVEIYKQDYKSAESGNYDIYVVFVEKGLSLLNKTGKLGFILPHKFFNAQYGEGLRSILSSGKHLSQIVHFGDLQVFDRATTYTCLLFLDKAASDTCSFDQVKSLLTWVNANESEKQSIPSEKIGNGSWNFSSGKNQKIFEKLRNMNTKLGDIAERMAQGIRTSANEIYVLDFISKKSGVMVAYSEQLKREVKLDVALSSFFLKGREIKPYIVLPSGKVVIVPYDYQEGHARLIPENEMSKNFKWTWEYLLENKTYLESREKNRMKGEGWYGYVYPKNIDVMKSSKILVPDIANKASFAIDTKGEYAFTSGYGIILNKTIQESREYLLGILNSRLLDFYLKQISTTMRGGYFRYFTQFIEQLPVRRIDFTNPKDRDRHDRMTTIVGQLLNTKKECGNQKNPHDLEIVERQMEALEAEINEIVFDLYGVSSAEKLA